MSFQSRLWKACRRLRSFRAGSERQGRCALPPHFTCNVAVSRVKAVKPRLQNIICHAAKLPLIYHSA